MRDIYKQAIMRFGTKAQLNVALKELAELQKEICKYFMGQYARENIIEEMTDVIIMLEQLKLIFEVSDSEILKAKAKKLMRLQKLIQEGERV